LIKIRILPLFRILRNVGALINGMSGDRSSIHLLAGSCVRSSKIDSLGIIKP